MTLLQSNSNNLQSPCFSHFYPTLVSKKQKNKFPVLLQVKFIDPDSLGRRVGSRETTPDSENIGGMSVDLSSYSICSGQDSGILPDQQSADFRPQLERNTKNRLTSFFDRDSPVPYRTKFVFFNNASGSQDCERAITTQPTISSFDQPGSSF